MEIQKEAFLVAAVQNGLSMQQADKLWEQLASSNSKETTKFDTPHVLYYFGALIVISSMAWFLGSKWESFGDSGIFAISLIYIALFIGIGHFLWHRKHLAVPGGLFITIAVSLVPLAIYTFQKMTGLWFVEAPGEYGDFYDWVRGGWFTMELGTIICSCMALLFYPFPFLTAPLFFCLWFMSMDITPLLYGKDYSFENRLTVSVWFGLALIVVSFLIDRRTQKDYAFWGYLFGVLTFWFGLSLLSSTSELENFFYCLVNIALIGLSILLQRRVFLIFGAIGVFCYLGSLSSRLFYDSALFPFVLTALGIALIFVGIGYQKFHKKIEAAMLNALPETIKNRLPWRRT